LAAGPHGPPGTQGLGPARLCALGRSDPAHSPHWRLGCCIRRVATSPLTRCSAPLHLQADLVDEAIRATNERYASMSPAEFASLKQAPQ
jgi:hypothetical protein